MEWNGMEEKGMIWKGKEGKGREGGRNARTRRRRKEAISRCEAIELSSTSRKRRRESVGTVDRDSRR